MSSDIFVYFDTTVASAINALPAVAEAFKPIGEDDYLQIETPKETTKYPAYPGGKMPVDATIISMHLHESPLNFAFLIRKDLDMVYCICWIIENEKDAMLRIIEKFCGALHPRAVYLGDERLSNEEVKAAYPPNRFSSLYDKSFDWTDEVKLIVERYNKAQAFL